MIPVRHQRRSSPAQEALQPSCRLAGIIPALAPNHALALPRDRVIVMNMGGRGDKDIFTVARHLGFDLKIGGDSAQIVAASPLCASGPFGVIRPCRPTAPVHATFRALLSRSERSVSAD